jgi:hypothetical protein
MDQDETRVVEGASDVAGAPASEADITLGPIFETLDARITIRLPGGLSPDELAELKERARSIDLTNPRIAEVVSEAVAEHCEISIDGGVTAFTVNVTVEKV